MKRKTSLLAASTFLAAATLALTATAQQVAPTATSATTPTATPPTQQHGAPTATPTMVPTSAPPTTTPSGSRQPSGTTTVTAADTTPGLTTMPAAVPPATSEPTTAETVTVHRKIRPNRPMLITGGILLVGTYVPTAVIQQDQGRAVEDSNLLIPVVGPWLNLADRRCDGCENESRNTALIVGSGVLQGIGAGLTIMSFFVPDKVAAATIQAGPVKLHVAPTQVGRTGMGLGTVGVF